jgi:hypothetical protein
MFDPQKHLKDILDAAYQSGRAHAEAIRKLTTPQPDGAQLDQARDLHCEMLAGAIARVSALDTLTLKQGVFTSAFSGFEDRRRELRTDPRAFDTGIFDKPDAAGVGAENK